MKKIAYQTPEVKVKTLFMDYLMEGSINGSGAGTDDITYGGIDNEGMDGDAKNGLNHHSVWDD